MAQAGHKDDQLPGQAQESSANGKMDEMTDANHGTSQEAHKQQAGE